MANCLQQGIPTVMLIGRDSNQGQRTSWLGDTSSLLKCWDQGAKEKLLIFSEKLTSQRNVAQNVLEKLIKHRRCVCSNVADSPLFRWKCCLEDIFNFQIKQGLLNRWRPFSKRTGVFPPGELTLPSGRLAVCSRLPPDEVSGSIPATTIIFPFAPAILMSSFSTYLEKHIYEKARNTKKLK